MKKFIFAFANIVKMNMKFEVFDHLVEESKKIRQKVFVDEQKFKEEFDENDSKAMHVLGYLEDVPVCTARVIFSLKHNSLTIGRVAVLKEHRLHQIGKQLMSKVEEEIIKRHGHVQVGVSSQLRAIPFYERVGYQTSGEIYLEENYPHIWMIKDL